jgi:hypothetical protein
MSHELSLKMKANPLSLSSFSSETKAESSLSLSQPLIFLFSSVALEPALIMDQTRYQVISLPLDAAVKCSVTYFC